MLASIVSGAMLLASANGQIAAPRCTEVCFVEPCAPCTPDATDLMSILPISTSVSGVMSVLPIPIPTPASPSPSPSPSPSDLIVTRPGPPTGNATSGVLSIPAGETPIGSASTVVSTTTSASVSSSSGGGTPTASSSSTPSAGVAARAVDAGVFGAMLGFAWALL